jgi:RNA polymerase sigma-70 factor (ECF subfamily)
MTIAPDNVTLLLRKWSDGDTGALAQLTPLVYNELHRLAHQYMTREKPGHMLQTTALVHEAYLRLIDQSQVRFENRAHFFAIAARLMRQILVDDARRRKSAKRGGGMAPIALDDASNLAQQEAENVLALDEALTLLAAKDRRESDIVELRFFGGLSVEETAEVLNVSPGTVARDWTFARAWLKDQMKARS